MGVETVVGRIGCEEKRNGTNGGPKKQKRKEGNPEGDTMGSTWQKHSTANSVFSRRSKSTKEKIGKRCDECKMGPEMVRQSLPDGHRFLAFAVVNVPPSSGAENFEDRSMKNARTFHSKFK